MEAAREWFERIGPENDPSSWNELYTPQELFEEAATLFRVEKPSLDSKKKSP